MIRLFINGISATAGGGLTYLRNVIPHLSRKADCQTTVLLSPELRREFAALPNITSIEMPEGAGVFRRFVREQTALPKMIRQNNSQVLISTGNFALWNSPVPQILLSRNSLYTSADFRRDLRSRHDYKILADTVLKGCVARQSIKQVQITVAPSEAFACELRQWTGKDVMALHHGFDTDAFTADKTPLSSDVKRQLEQAGDCLRLLFVSHYNYYRNFETLFRAMRILSGRLNKKVKLFLTCRLKSAENPGAYRADSAASLIQDNHGSSNIVELGTIPYRSLHHLYRACQIYVSPAYAESFAHPLIEAMSTGLPVVASDLAVHREICEDAALYFSRFSPEELAAQVLRIHESQQLAQKISSTGLRRARDFNWSNHVDRLLVLAEDLIRSKQVQN
jgi:glycosyltransferase involved in cell wall biosynthesis